MNFRKHYSVTLFLLLTLIPVYSQVTHGMYYNVETGIIFSAGEHAPFWLTSNRYGLSSIKNNNGYIRAGVFRPLEKDKQFSYSFGLDLAGAYNFTSSFIIQQAYIDLKYRFLKLSVGSKERLPELKNTNLSSGGMTFSNNARPIPQVRIGISEYVAIPGTKKFLAFKGHIAYGMFTDDHWQKHFAASKNKYTEHVLYHSKALYAKIGNESKFPLVFEGGLEMVAQFGGNAYNVTSYTPYINMPNGLKDFFKVFIPMSGGSDTPAGEQANIYGNHLGSWNFSLSYKFTNWKLRGYYDHFFEDHSMMFGQYGWKDCLAGLEITLPKNPFMENFVYEYIGTKDQSGPIFHDQTSAIPDQISAIDNYYNHGIYTGWQHWGMGIGNPLIISPIYNKDGIITFRSNRIQAHHIGFSGRPNKEWYYRVLFSFSKNWGTYFEPLPQIKRQFSTLIEVTYKPQVLRGWNFTLAGALDGGNMLDSNQGIMLKINKTGLISKRK